MRKPNQISSNRPLRIERETIYPYPDIPPEVRDTLEDFFRIDNINKVNKDNLAIDVSRREELGKVNRVLELVRTYCNVEINDYAYFAAALGRVEDLSDGLAEYGRGSIRARQALGDFFTASNGDTNSKPVNAETSPRNIYIAGLLQDRRRLDRFRNEVKTGDDVFDYRQPPSEAEWLTNPTLTDPDTLYDLASSINIESILISGVETLHTLSENGTNSRETLDLIRYSEQIIAPVAEVIGFDTLSMALNSTTKSIRVEHAGRKDLLMKADAMISRFRKFDTNHSVGTNVKRAFTDITSALLSEEDNVPLTPNLPVSYGTNNRAIYGDTRRGRVDTPDGEVRVGWRFRLKSRGSLAWKMLKAEQEGKDSSITPMDILGITAIVDSDAEQIKLFRAMANGLYSSKELDPYAAPSKSAAICVRGLPEYMEAMTRNINADKIDFTPATTEDDIHWGKVTGFYGDLPFEVQCITRHYRDAMQTGPLAHVIYKANMHGRLPKTEVVRWSNLLSKIRERRKTLHKIELTDASQLDSNNKSKIVVAQEFVKQCLNASKEINTTVGFVAENATAINTDKN